LRWLPWLAPDRGVMRPLAPSFGGVSPFGASCWLSS
jgi:hypothetical protein